MRVVAERVLLFFRAELRLLSGTVNMRGLIAMIAGYGATTLPSITEALTFERNATLAEQEAARVAALLDKLSETIKV